jgi:hypothetical protein
MNKYAGRARRGVIAGLVVIAGALALTISEAGVTVTGPASTRLDFPISRSGDTTYDAFVECPTLDGTVLAATPYTAALGSLVIPARAAIATIPSGAIVFTTNLGVASNIITVSNTADPASTSGNGFCTLREAIDNANSPGTDTTGGDCAAGTGTDTINFSVSGTITLGSTLPAIANSSPNSLTIDGSGQTITIDGANSYQVFGVNSGATLPSMT